MGFAPSRLYPAAGCCCLLSHSHCDKGKLGVPMLGSPWRVALSSENPCVEPGWAGESAHGWTGSGCPQGKKGGLPQHQQSLGEVKSLSQTKISSRECVPSLVAWNFTDFFFSFKKILNCGYCEVKQCLMTATRKRVLSCSRFVWMDCSPTEPISK